MTQMIREAQQTPELLTAQLQKNAPVMKKIAARLQSDPVKFALTVARGSSDHAATFAKYLFETQLGLVTASAAPSVQTLYHAKLHLENALVVGISQSGTSEDICATLKMARDNHAITVALVNNTDSKLAQIAEYVIDVSAGPELAVAATKSYILSLTALTQLTATLNNDSELTTALTHLPKQLKQALNADWSEFVEYYQNMHDTIVIGRGYGYPIAQESALKFKETSAIHAEPFSSAEFLHGPFALLKEHYPVFCYAQHDAAYNSVLGLIERANALESHTFLAAPENLERNDQARHYLPLPVSVHPICDPIVAIQAFYPAIAELAVARGFNPDQPKNLQKVTSTK